MKEIRYKKVRELRIQKGMTAKDVVNLINPMRMKRNAKPISVVTYYKKEIGEIPVFIEEAEEIGKALGKDYKIFYS